MKSLPLFGLVVLALAACGDKSNEKPPNTEAAASQTETAAALPETAPSRLFLSGNEAVALAVRDAGCRVAAAYPGTPATEILEELSRFPDLYTEWSVNEKVSLEVALGASIEHLATTAKNTKAAVLAKTLDQAISQVLDNNRSPARKIGEIDNRGSHFYVAQYWAQALAAQNEDTELKAHFAPLAKVLTEKEPTILAELIAAQGKPVDLGGYYRPDVTKTSAAMRPSATLNAALAAL